MQFIRRLSAALLSLSLTCLAESQARAAVPAHARSSARAHAADEDGRILHALNRFTFGPRPGDLAAVRTIGLERWLQQQLHPDSLDESELQTHLAMFPAMQWKTDELLYRLPSNAVIRQALAGRIPVPTDATLHAIYSNQMERIAARQQARAGAQPMSGAGSPPRASTPPEAPVASQLSLSPGAILNLPPAERLAKLAALPQPDLDEFLHELRPPQRGRLEAGLDPEQRQTLSALQQPERTVVDELTGERLARDIYSGAQLQEVMTDFWLNHFNVFLHKDETMPYYLVSYERDTIRPHALGRFEYLLEATAHSPAMLLYLDNASSVGPGSPAARRAASNQHRAHAPDGVNENYGRELMELHTLGVKGGYSQADVVQAARILTGWTVDRPQRGGGFQFNTNRHEPGVETVMGHRFAGSGEQQGRDLLHFLATRPATARLICRELAVRFVSDNPPPALIARMTRAWRKSDGDIPAVLTALFHSPEFWSSDARQAKVKTPLEYVVSAVRAGNGDVQNFVPLENALRRMGMPVFGCIPPDGYTWQSSAWVSAGAMADRMNFALALAASRLPGIRIDWSASMTDEAPSPASEEHRLEKMLLPGGVSPSTRAAILAQLQQQSASPAAARPVSGDLRPRNGPRALSLQQAEDQFLAGLLLGSPAFQRR